jgi:alkanesulfonate monooxygenase SsuD/methylene tetrahydromethanopterin reductase-like flavin-dependent oxidoreductase (luciferase family)
MTATVAVGLSVYSGLAEKTVPYLDAASAPYESLWFPDHLQSNTEGVTEGWTLLSYALARYPDKTCGHQVLCNEFRHPAQLAKMAASAQMLSSGRFVLGIGAGWHRAEAVAYGMDLPTTPVRVERLGEAIEIMRAMWTGQATTYEGQYFRVVEAECLPPPDPIPPVMIGGSGERHLLGAVAGHADWWNHVYRDPSEFGHKLGVLGEHCERIGRDPTSVTPVLGTHVLIGETDAEVRRLKDRSDVRSVERNGIAGTPGQIFERFAEAIALGARRIIVGFADSPRPDGAHLFAETVLGRLTSNA